MVNRLQRLSMLSAMIVVSGIAADATAAEPYPGYIFCASGQKAYLIDPTGKTVHTWQASCSARSCAYLLPDGGALFPIRTECPVKGDGAYSHGRVQKISWEGNVVWDAVVCDNTMTPGYDLEPMPNGNVMVAGLPKINDMEALARGDDGDIYILASQSCNKSGELPDERKLFIRVARSNGHFTLKGSVRLFDVLFAAVQKKPEQPWARYISGAIDDSTLDIEGVAFRQGTLYLGIKAPLLDGCAIIVSIGAADELFGAGAPDPRNIAIWRQWKLTDPVAGASSGISDLYFNGDTLYALAVTETESDDSRATNGTLWRYRYDLEKAERKQYISLLGFSYDNGEMFEELVKKNDGKRHNPNNAYMVELGVKIPDLTAARHDLSRRKAAYLSEKEEYEEVKRELVAQMKKDKEDLSSFIAQYRFLKARETQVDANSSLKKYLQMSGVDPLVLLTIQESIVKNHAEIAKLKFRILRNYISVIDFAGELTKKPLKNYLSKNREPLQP